MKLNEILSKKVDYEVTKETSERFDTMAKIGDRTISFTSGKVDHGDSLETWDVEFAEIKNGKKTYAASGSGNELEVFSMIKDSILELVSRYHPDKITFTAQKEGEGDKRANAYERLVKRFNIPGYTYNRDKEYSDFDQFEIVKK